MGATTTTTTTVMAGTAILLDALRRPPKKKARAVSRAHKEHLMQGINNASQRQHQSRPSP